MPITNPASLRINAQRFRADFDALGRIGATKAGGSHRPALSPAHLEARAWLRARAREASLEVRVDGAGNHSALLRCGQPAAPCLLLGSHLDTVPNGGCYDGALGVLAALEALRTVSESGLKLNVDLEAIDFTDEEGTLCSFLGSHAVAGNLRPQDLEAPRGGREAFEAGLSRAGLTRDGVLSAARPRDHFAGYLELHIEQGRRLEAAGVAIGVVSAIPGIGFYQLVFTGRADHAGTSPLDERLDAARGAAAFVLSYPGVVLSGFPNCFANVGRMRLEPGASNIVPERAVLSLEYRSPQTETFERLGAALIENAREQAAQTGLGFEAEFLGSHPPAAMDAAVQAQITAAAADLSLTNMTLPSRAGHDAQTMAALCPAGMIFVPSVGGASHSPAEFTRWEDCVNGANVLLQTALRLAA